MKKYQTLIFWGALLIFIYSFLEISFFLGLWALHQWKNISYQPIVFELDERNRKQINDLIAGSSGFVKLSERLGWINIPNSQFPKHTESKRFTINFQGIRSLKDYSPDPPEGMTRISAFGDSFTFGGEVSDKECWTERLNLLCPQIEVLNFGVAGYSIDQAFLRYQEEGDKFNPHVVFIGFLTENIKRHVNVFRPFLYRDGLPASKPRFMLEKDGLKLFENPLPAIKDYEMLLIDTQRVLSEMGRYDYFYQQGIHQGRFDVLPSVRFSKIVYHNMITRFSDNDIFKRGQYNINSEAFKITVKLFERFKQQVVADNAVPIIIIFPHQEDIEEYRNRKVKSYIPLINYFKNNGVQYIDLMDAFEKSGEHCEIADLFSKGGHYSPPGNDAVARHLLDYLYDENLIGQ